MEKGELIVVLPLWLWPKKAAMPVEHGRDMEEVTSPRPANVHIAKAEPTTTRRQVAERRRKVSMETSRGYLKGTGIECEFECGELLPSTYGWRWARMIIIDGRGAAAPEDEKGFR